jgi:polynucleotide 5'-hydroxyl-kinase GRC3/NOL9
LEAELMIDIPEPWAWSVEQIESHAWRKILVLGDTDRGKSTYCRFLCEQLLSSHQGETVAYVDADVGQKDIGPPAAITLGYPQLNIPWTQIEPAAWHFVGHVTPIGQLLPTVLGTQHLVNIAQATRIIINTLGFVRGAGRILQAHLIEAIRPDVIIALVQGRELSALLQPYRYHRTLRLPPSPMASIKTPSERQANREGAFWRYFSTAQHVSLHLRDLVLQRTLLFTGTRIHLPPFPYAERTDEGIVAVARADMPVPPHVRTMPLDFERHLLCGLSNRRRQGIGLGIVQRIDFDHGTLALMTPVPVEQIRMLQFGDIYVGTDGRELGRRDHRVW